MTDFDAIVLAGGTSVRMGGGDKTALTVGGRPVLDRVLDAVAGARTRVVAGVRRPTARPVTWCREDPPGGGPAAAVAAALPYVEADVVVLVGGDYPLLTTDAVARLVEAIEGDGAVAVAEDQQPQWLVSAWRTSALRNAEWHEGGSLRAAMQKLRWNPVRLPEEVLLDCDRPADISRAEHVAR